MSDNKPSPNGGPAFPRSGADWKATNTLGGVVIDSESRWSDHQDGMSLWDYYAAHALQAIVGSSGNPILMEELAMFCKHSAVGAFDLADAMIAEREKRFKADVD